MSYVSTTTLQGKSLKVFLNDTDKFIVGESHHITFDIEPHLNGTWKIIEVKDGEFIVLDREKKNIFSEWYPGVVTITYPKNNK